MRNYTVPTAHIVCADVAVAGSFWDELSFSKLEGLNTSETSSIVDVDVDNNPEGTI